MNVILVGPGGMGTVHYNNYQHIPEARVAAIVGTAEADKQKAAAWGLPLFATITEACRQVDAQLVDICVPTFLHKGLALESIAQGKHALTEKPAALSKADAEAMFEAARQKGVQLYVAQVLQFTREVEQLHQVEKDGRYGAPLDASFERLSACPQWSQGSWLTDKRKSGLVPFDLHIHDLDVIVSLFGKPKTVRYTSCGGPNKAYREQYRFTYGYDGLNVSAEAAWFNAAIPFTARWRVYFDHGMLVCGADGLKGYDADGTTTVFDVEEKLKIPTGINLPPTGMFLNELSHFVARAQANQPSERVPEKQVLAVLEVLESIQ